jgi:hypothetical protein
MFKSLLTTESDLKEAAIIEKRRNAEEERKKRFFDAKQRILGVDCNELDRQVMEKEKALQAQREQERLEAEEMRKNLEIAEARENELREQKKQSEVELNEFRKLCQQPKDCNDFDLNDPEGKKKTLPARLDDADPRLSKSGGQLFLGEDLTHQNRIREQKILQKQWLDQQIAERKNLEMNRKKSDDLMDASISKYDVYSVSQSDRLMTEKRDLQRQIREYNEALAKQKRENEKKRKEMEQQDNLAEVYNLLSSDFLKETQLKGSNLGPNRIIPYSYKHMSDEQIQQLQKEQEMQAADIQRKKNEEAEEKRQFDQLIADNYREMTLKERALSRNIRNMNHNLQSENEELAKQQKHKIEHFEKVVNTNPPTNEYFDQFNTTSR